MRGYEAIFIFRPSLTEEDRMRLVEKIEKIISTNGALYESNYWGRKRFAYPIQKFSDGHFYLFVFNAEATVPYELKRLTKVTETILRSLIIVKKTTFLAKETLPQEAQSIVDTLKPNNEQNVEPTIENTNVEEVLVEETNAE